MTAQKLFCFGHRGASGHEPENTVRSVRRALELGADGIEVRVFGWQAHKTGRALRMSRSKNLIFRLAIWRRLWE
jgi:hypothetical protein